MITASQFSAITAERIPTPNELVAFAEGQRWKFQVDPSGAALVASKTDPLAVAFARMLSREPYRTNVLKLLSERSPAEDRPAPKPEPVRPPEPEKVTCDVCGKDVSDPETRERMADALYCSQGGSKAVTDGNGVYHPETARCPFKNHR